MKHLVSTVFIAALVGLLSPGCNPGYNSRATHEPTPNTVFVTWDTMETDKIASIWLIKRFVEPDAGFRFVAKGSDITNGIPFDTPDAQYRRYHGLSCFESILKRHNLSDPGLVRIGEFMHDLEINYWAEKRFPESAALDRQIQAIVATHTESPAGCVTACEAVFDELYRSEATPSRGEADRQIPDME